MKRFLWVFFAVLFFGVCIWRYRSHPPAPSNSPSAEEDSQIPQKVLQGGPATLAERNTEVPSAFQAPPSGLSGAEQAQSSLATQETQRKEFEAKWKAQWSAPIKFFGKVVDEKGRPLAGAAVVFTWNNWEDVSAERSSRLQSATDSQGIFSLANKTGKRLSVVASKPGYYPTGSARQSFEFGDPVNGVFKPDPAHPIVFSLRKRGPGADLITSQQGLKDYLGVDAPLDRNPVQVNLLERKVGHGPLTIIQAKPPYETWKQASEWSFRLEMSGGGFIEQEDEFPFEAPENGYQQVVEYSFQSGQTNWATNLSKNYYIVFGDPPRYGRLHLETSIMMSGARLTYSINPNGSRYLEPK